MHGRAWRMVRMRQCDDWHAMCWHNDIYIYCCWTHGVCSMIVSRACHLMNGSGVKCSAVSKNTWLGHCCNAPAPTATAKSPSHWHISKCSEFDASDSSSMLTASCTLSARSRLCGKSYYALYWQFCAHSRLQGPIQNFSGPRVYAASAAPMSIMCADS